VNAPWVTYRPELKVLDCTIRDGGLVNDHHFDSDIVKAVYETCIEAGLDYMEIGYRNSKELFPKKDFGPFRHSDEEDIRAIVGDQDAHEKGYETSLNLMAISIVQETEIDAALEALVKTPVEVICVVDSFGALYREQIDLLVNKYMEAVKGTGKEIGIHAHNNQQLAFANTIEAIILGSNRADATMAGLGRGAGNCPMELLMGFLRNPKFKRRPIYKLLQDHFVPLREELEWGALIPYNITGQHNEHPREAIALRGGDDKDNYVSFYDKIVGDI
jgi:4-hydroxy 2-oxovalerate aldolase